MGDRFSCFNVEFGNIHRLHTLVQIGFASKVRSRAWKRSVPPAVAGGSTSRIPNHLQFRMPTIDPPATQVVLTRSKNDFRLLRQSPFRLCCALWNSQDPSTQFTPPTLREMDPLQHSYK